MHSYFEKKSDIFKWCPATRRIALLNILHHKGAFMALVYKANMFATI